MEMPKIYVNPPRSEWPALTARCTRQEEEIGERVAAILAEVRTGGDAALRRIVRRIEGYLPETFEVTRERRAEAAKAVSPQLKAALAQAKANIEAFHRAPLPRSNPQIKKDGPAPGQSRLFSFSAHPYSWMFPCSPFFLARFLLPATVITMISITATIAAIPMIPQSESPCFSGSTGASGTTGSVFSSTATMLSYSA